MVAAEWNIGIDINRDGWFAEDVTSSEPISILFYGSTFKDIPTANAPGDSLIKSTALRNFAYGTVAYTFSANGAGADTWFFGYDGTAFYIECLPSTEYTVCFWFRGFDNYTGDNISWQVVESSGPGSSTVTAPFVAGYTQTSVTFTTNATTLRMGLIIGHVDIRVMSFVCAGFMIVPGAVVPTVFNSGHRSDMHENIMDYVISAQWSNAMPSAYEEFAGDNKMTIVLDNKDGRFDQDYLTGDQLANGDFSSWTAGVPDSWALTSTVGGTGTAGITQVASGGGAGTGAVDFTLTTVSPNSAEALISLSQSDILSILGQRYKVTIICSHTSDERTYFQLYNGDNPISYKFSALGTKTFYFTSNASGDFNIRVYMLSTLNNTTHLVIDSVACEVASRYAGIERGSLVWVRATYSGTDYPLCVMRLDNITPNVGLYNVPQVALECIDPMPDLLKSEYIPYFAQDQTLDTVIVNVLARTSFTYPYVNEYWILGVEGASRLGEETYLFSSANAYHSNSSQTVLDFTGDMVSADATGVSAQAYIRDIVAAELGGRFYWDARNAYFTLMGRLRDATNLGAAAGGFTYTDDDIDSVEYRFADDLINSAIVNYTQRTFGDSYEVLWASSEDIVMQPGQSRSITGRYRDPSSESVRVSAYTTLPLSPGVDYTVVPANRALRIAVAVTADSQSATFQITSSATAAEITVQGLQIRGIRINNFDRQFVEALNAESLFRRDKYEVTANIPVISNVDDVTNYALSMVERYGDPITRFESITWIANKGDTRMTRALAQLLDVSLTVTMTNGHNRRYIAVGERYQLTAGGEHTLQCTRILKPSERAAFWYLGEAGYSELGSTTLLAF